MEAPGREWRLRYGLGLIASALIVLFALLHLAAPHVYLFLTRIPDGVAKPYPFVDLHAILQGAACWRAGVDVYRPSACLDGGVFNYTPLLLRVAWVAGPDDAFAGGLLFCVAYAYALMALPAPRGWGEFWLRAAAAFSPAAYYALEQGNLDVLIFALTVLALRLPWRWRWAGYGIFGLGAAAKFYPVALFGLALRERRIVLAGLAAAGLAVLALALAVDAHGFAAALRQVPSGTPFRASFGRIDLTRGLERLGVLPWGSAAGWSWVLALAALAVAGTQVRRWQRALADLPGQERVFLLAGALVVLFCDLAAQNIEYRAIFLILLLPGLARGGWRLRLLGLLIVALLWEAVPRAVLLGLAQPYLPGGAGLGFWLLREAAWWWVAVELMGATLAYVLAQGRRLACEN